MPTDETKFDKQGRKDWGRMSRDKRTQMEEADRQEREAGPIRKALRAAYYPIIGDAPELGPGDVEGAAAYLMKITRALGRGGWTRSEARRLRDLHLKWSRRAKGEDAYFMVYGNKRQWADHAKTKAQGKAKVVADSTSRIKEVIRQETLKQRATLGRETPEEAARRREETEIARARKDQEQEETGGMD